MKEYTVNLGINEAATIVSPRSRESDSPYITQQSQMNQYVTHDLIYEYTPNFNGGYIILVEPGPWLELLKYDSRLRDKYGSALDGFESVVKDFILKSMKLAFQIDPGSVNVSADNYNLRHLSQNVFSYETKISSVGITYLEEKNMVEFIHYLWIEFMKDLKKGFVELPDEYLADDTDIFYQVPYYGQIWAYAYNPVDLRPKEIVKYIGVFPSGNNLSDEFGQRGQNNHYMKNITYNVVDFDRSVFPLHTNKITFSNKDFENFYNKSKLFKDFIDTCVEYGILGEYQTNNVASYYDSDVEQNYASNINQYDNISADQNATSTTVTV